MNDKWANGFQQKLREKENARQESVKKFNFYRDAVLQLFAKIEDKVKNVEPITAKRKLNTQSNPAVGGPSEAMSALVLKCQEKFLEFVPEGINLDSSRGRIRVRHNSGLAQFVYLHLIIDRQSDKSYPDNLAWVINEDGNAEEFNELPAFDEVMLEKIIESSFLS